ncbi:MAG: uroporphyrinogen decarboxylase family protein [Candidatus Hodarchaeota archaeon]
MNSRERILTAFQHKEPDRVPLFEPWIESEVCGFFGMNCYDVREKLQLDGFPLGTYPAGKTQAYGNGIDEWGRIFKNGQYYDGLVKNEVNLKNFTPPLSHAEDWFPKERVKHVKKKYGDNYALYFAWHDCSLGLTYLSMGMKDFFLGLYEKPELIQGLIERNTDWTIALVEQANINGADFIVLGDDVADNSRPFISPRMFRKLILPEYKKITLASDVPIIWHSDGNVAPLLPMIIEAGFIGVHSLEPKANIDLGKIKNQYGEKLVLCGNLDATEVLTQSDLAIVRKDVERCIREGAPKGGYLFSSSNSLFEGHNLQAITEAYNYAKKIGHYPIKSKNY